MKKAVSKMINHGCEEVMCHFLHSHNVYNTIVHIFNYIWKIECQIVLEDLNVHESFVCMGATRGSLDLALFSKQGSY